MVLAPSEGQVRDRSRVEGIPLGRKQKMVTLPETNIAPENGWLQDEMSFSDALFSGDIR